MLSALDGQPTIEQNLPHRNTSSSTLQEAEKDTTCKLQSLGRYKAPMGTSHKEGSRQRPEPDAIPPEAV
ncbi:hypothetical protein M433DRAFT_10236 [Acidomyces richmondensis BFW]|nr:hypothetical protein M433DRAFT_10236 [Acidomyces richmondensis BFW]